MQTELGMPGCRGRSTISPPLICGPPERQSSSGQISHATVTSRRSVRVFRARGRLFRPGDQVSREVNRGRAADVAPGPIYLPRFVFSPRTWSFPPKNNLGNNAELALLANFLVRGGSCVRARPTRRENNYGDTAVEATSLAWCAGVGFVPPARRHPQGTSATAAHST